MVCFESSGVPVWPLPFGLPISRPSNRPACWPASPFQIDITIPVSARPLGAIGPFPVCAAVVYQIELPKFEKKPFLIFNSFHCNCADPIWFGTLRNFRLGPAAAGKRDGRPASPLNAAPSQCVIKYSNYLIPNPPRAFSDRLV